MKKCFVCIYIFSLYFNFENYKTILAQEFNGDFDKLILHTEFDKNNLPSINFFYQDKKNWKLNDSKKNEYCVKGDISKANGSIILSMEYYCYRGINPFYYEDERYVSSIIKNFNFYRFKGKGLGFVDLDNYLLAVDRETLYIFVYAKPIKFKHLFGHDIPIEWGAIDNVHSKKFYEYDPAGFIGKDGKAVMYEWFKNSMKEKKYEVIDTGKSPYKNRANF